MPQVEVRTRLVPVRRSGQRKRDNLLGETEVLMEILLVPRGSGNRKWAVALGKAAKAHPELGPHVKRVRVGSSKVWVTLLPSPSLLASMMSWNQRRLESADVPGQLPLFGGAIPT
jgi:hypothetical protein